MSDTALSLAGSGAQPSTPRSSLLLQGSEAGSSGHTSRSPSQSPRRSETAPELHGVDSAPRAPKRIIVLCDGTWEDGIRDQQRSSYTNVLRLARALHHEDPRGEGEPPIMQVVFYQPGIGSDKNLYSEYVEGTTGNSLPDKVEDAYAFIAHNFNPGDEIFLFGFSRGAYTARMIAMFIGAIGVLPRYEMDHFATIFLNFQKLGLCGEGDKEEKAKLEAELARWRSPNSEGLKRATHGKDKFTVKCVGVWDTVGSLGLPEELQLLPQKRRLLFGFPDCQLGEHIEMAYQALAINELRRDFDCTKFIQSAAGKAKGQILKQTWFSGCHADIGGGYPEHDLSDLSLIWMAANVETNLYIDTAYLKKLTDPVAPWGEQMPHDSRTGVFAISFKLQRTLPTAPNPDTHETVHASVLRQLEARQNGALDALAQSIKAHPALLAEPLPLEYELRGMWGYDAESARARAYAHTLKHPPATATSQASSASSSPVQVERRLSWFSSVMRSVSSGSGFSRRSRSSVSISTSASGSTQPTDTDGMEASASSVEVVKKSRVSVTTANVYAKGRKCERVDTSVAKSTTIVVHSPTS